MDQVQIKKKKEKEGNNLLAREQMAGLRWLK